MTKENLKKTATSLGWLICSMGMLFYAYEYLLRISPSVMEPNLRSYFNINAEGFGSLVGLYYIAYTPMQLFVGGLVDLYGPRLILAFATIICAIGAFMFGSTHIVWIAGIGRFLVGFGSAFAFVSALKLASVWLPINRFAMFTGLVTALGMVGGMVGDIGLTHVVERWGWQMTILYGAGIGLILAPLITLIVRNHPPEHAQQMVPLKVKEIFHALFNIAKNPQIWLAGLIACMLYLSLSAFAEIWGIPYLRTALGFTPQQAALANSMVFFGWLIGSPVMGYLSDAMGNRRKPLIVGGILAAASIAAVLYLQIHAVWLVAALLFCFGLFCSAENVCFAVGQESSPHRVAGTAVAFVNMLTMLGGFIFQPLVGKLLDIVWDGQMQNGVRVYTSHEYHIALTVLPIAMIVGVILASIMRESFNTQRA